MVRSFWFRATDGDNVHMDDVLAFQRLIARLALQLGYTRLGPRNGELSGKHTKLTPDICRLAFLEEQSQAAQLAIERVA